MYSKIAYAARSSCVAGWSCSSRFDRYYMDVMTDTPSEVTCGLSAPTARSLRQITEGFDAVGSGCIYILQGDAIAFGAVEGETSHIYSTNTGLRAREPSWVRICPGPASLSFSPDGQWLAFAMPVDLSARDDGRGYLLRSQEVRGSGRSQSWLKRASQFRVDGGWLLAVQSVTRCF